jgi:hypothetical protein
MLEAVTDVAEGNISIEELTVALNHAVACRRNRQIAQRGHRDDPEDARVTERDMVAFNKSAAAIAKSRERAAAWKR